MLDGVWERIGTAVKHGKGVKLTFEEAAVILAQRDRHPMCVGGTPADECLGSILLTAMQLTDSKRDLQSIGCLVVADTFCTLADADDMAFVNEHRERMLRAGVFPAGSVAGSVTHVLTWLKMVQESGKELPFKPYDREFVKVLHKISKRFNPKGK